MTFTAAIFAYCPRLWFFSAISCLIFVCLSIGVVLVGSALTSYCQIKLGFHLLTLYANANFNILFSCLRLTFFPYGGFLFTATFRSHNAHFVWRLSKHFLNQAKCFYFVRFGFDIVIVNWYFISSKFLCVIIFIFFGLLLSEPAQQHCGAIRAGIVYENTYLFSRQRDDIANPKLL